MNSNPLESSAAVGSARAVQIIAPVNHEFQLDVENLKQILESDGIKDRYAVVISIAGALRKGKSFLLNFILKYLNAQYKKHDVSDWLNGEMVGFKSRGGQQPETTGIWMWSEIFTHDFPNGEKVAIILLDTQGIFDHRSNTKDNTTTFAISMMLASVQCYNLFQNIQENDLQNLELFSEYGRLALQQSTEKTFQKLIFIVRDWPYADENAFGDGQPVVDDLLAETAIQSNENHQLRRNIKSSFQQIGAFLLPHPGTAVATGRFNGNLREIDADFLKYLKVLVPSLCAPENLIVKKINGQKIRASEITVFLQNYVNVFKGGAVPEPQSILEATAAANNLLLFNECVALYYGSMFKQIVERSQNEDKPYFDQTELLDIHRMEKGKSISQFQGRPKLGSVETVKSFETRIIDDIESKYTTFKQENEKKRADHEEKMKTIIRASSSACLKLYSDSMQTSFSNVQTFLSQSDLQNTHNAAKNEAISKFNNERKPNWDDTFTEEILHKLKNDIQSRYLQFERENERKEQLVKETQRKAEEALAKALADARAAELERARKETEANNRNTQLYREHLTRYSNAMNQFVNNCSPFCGPEKLWRAHEIEKNNSLGQFDRSRAEGGNHVELRNRLQNDIDSNMNIIRNTNDRKRNAYEADRERERLRTEAEAARRRLEWQREIYRRNNSDGGSRCLIS